MNSQQYPGGPPGILGAMGVAALGPKRSHKATALAVRLLSQCWLTMALCTHPPTQPPLPRPHPYPWYRKCRLVQQQPAALLPAAVHQEHMQHVPPRSSLHAAAASLAPCRATGREGHVLEDVVQGVDDLVKVRPVVVAVGPAALHQLLASLRHLLAKPTRSTAACTSHQLC